MGNVFWSNTIWYILIAVLMLIQIFFVLKKTNNRKHAIALFFVIAGMTFAFEATVFLYLKAYDYFPLIIPQSRINDGLAGNLFSQFSVTATALLIAVYNLKYYWFFICAILYGIIEELFLKLAIYWHNWYQTWMTVLSLVLLFGITKRLYQSRMLYIRNFWWYLLMSFGLYTLHMPTVLWINILAGIIVINTEVLPDPMHSFATICLLNLIFLSIGCMFVYFSKLKLLWKSLITLVFYLSVYFAYKMNLIYIREGWFWIFATIDIFGMYLCIFILDKLTTHPPTHFKEQ